MKDLKLIALEKLKEIELNSYEDTCQSIISFSQNGLFIEAKKLLLKEIKFLDKRGLVKDNAPFLLLKSISKYLYNLSISAFNQTLEEETKGLIKQIKIILKYLEKNYDEHFLLIKNQDKFLAMENAIFLNFADELSSILNQVNYIKEADKLFILKSKIELGFSRYSFNQKNKILILYFDAQGNFKLPNDIQKVKIMEEYLVDEILFRNYVDELENLNKIELEEKLLYLKLLKDRDKSKFVKELNNLQKYLEYFPEFVWDEKYYVQYVEILNSINSNLEISSKKMPKRKVLFNLDYIKTINLVIQVLKDE